MALILFASGWVQRPPYAAGESHNLATTAGAALLPDQRPPYAAGESHNDQVWETVTAPASAQRPPYAAGESHNTNSRASSCFGA